MPTHDVKEKAISLRNVAISGVLWLTLTSVVARLTGILSQLALAHILTTANFGEIGLASTVSIFVTNITGFGLDDVLVQRRRALSYWSGTALLISVGLACMGAFIMVALSPIAARIYRVPSIVGLLAVSALTLPISALSMLPQANLRAMMRFKLLTSLSAIEVVASGTLVVAFALAGFGAYCFVIPPLVVAIIKAVTYWVIAPVGLRRPRRGRAKYLLGRAFSIFGHRIVVSLVGQGDYALLGALTNSSQVGLYYFAFRLAIQPITVLAGNVSGVLFPLLSQYKLQPERQKEIVLRSLKSLNMIVMPVCTLQAALAHPLVPILFGAKWNPAINMIVVLTLGISVEAAAWQAGALLNSRGKFGKTFKYTSAISPLFFICIVVGFALDGAFGVACGVAIYYLVFSGLFTYLALRDDGVTAKQVAAIYLIPAIMAISSIGAGTLLGGLPPFAEHPLLRSVIIIVIGVTGYIVLWKQFASESYAAVVSWAFELWANRLAESRIGPILNKLRSRPMLP
jgi:O-antigen/teichoic acid export membrane protein